MIDNVISQLQTLSHPATPGEMIAFVIDVEQYMEESAVFQDAAVELTDEPSSLVNVRCEVANSVSSLQQLSDHLQQVWNELAYNTFQATSINWYVEATVLRFVTVIASNSWFVSGSIVVGGDHHLVLARSFEKNFVKLKPFQEKPLH